MPLNTALDTSLDSVRDSSLDSHPVCTDCPDDSIQGLARLAALFFRGQDVAPAYRELAEKLRLDDSNVAPLIDVAILDQLLGQPERALAIQAAALTANRVFSVRTANRAPKLRLLGFVMAGPLNANAPIEFMIEDSDVALTLLYIVPGLPLPPVPEHDLAMVLVGESERARPVLQELEALLPAWPRPVVNRPELVPLLGRETLYRLAESIDGLCVPVTVRVDAEDLQRIGTGELPVEAFLPESDFPIIVRPLDSHGGYGLERLDSAAEIAGYLERTAVTTYFISPFVEYSGVDGRYRKYRIAVIDGVAFPSHLAVSSRWMVHFVNADMLDHEGNRLEEAQFMETFADDFGRRHGPALKRLAELSGLEYFGVDCAETRDRRLLLFEADTSLIVHNLDSPEIFPYKQRPMESLFEAFREMLFCNARRAVSVS